MAFPGDFNRRIAITIDHTQIDSDLTDWTLVFDQDFDPVLTSVDGPLDADGNAPAQSDGGDIRFSSDEAGTNRLAVDVRCWTPDNDPTLSTACLAVKVPTVSSSADTTIYMWWGTSTTESQPAATDTYGQYNAYDDNYLVVMPLNEIVSGEVKDRTSNQNDGVASGLDDNDYVSAPLGGGLRFDGNSSHIVLPDAVVNALSETSFTVQIGVNRSSTENDTMFSVIIHSGWDGYIIFRNNDQHADIKILTSNTDYGVDFNTPLPQDTWAFATAVLDSGTELELFRDDASQGTDWVSGTISVSSAVEDAWVGADPREIDYFDGDLFEFRLATTNRSTAWVKADYRNIFNETDFLTWGTVEDVGGATEDLTATDVISSSEIGPATLGQTHALGSTDIISPAEIGQATVGQEHGLTAIDLMSVSEIGTATAGQVHVLTSADLISVSEVSTASIGQVHALTSTDVVSSSEIGTASISTEGTDALISTDLTSASEVDVATIGQEHGLTATDLTSASEIDTAAIGESGVTIPVMMHHYATMRN